VDEAVGRFVRYLKTHQLYDRSTIVLVADHGEGLGDHGEQGHGLLAYEETLHVPLIVKQPGAEEAGRRVPDLVQQIDIVPTILDLAKAPIPGNLRGRSLTSLFAGDTREALPVYSESLYAHYHFGWGAITTVTDGQYRFISAPREELYDLRSDPDERHNLIDDQADIVERLRTELKNLSGEGPIPDMKPVSAGERAKLEALGYVGTFVDDMPASAPEDAKDHLQLVEGYRLAADEAANGRWAAAIASYRALIQEHPSVADLWMHLGQAAGRLERFELASDAFRRAALLLPNVPDAHVSAGFALLHVRKLDEARAQAQEVIDTPRVDAAAEATAHELLARVALARHDLATARSEATLAETADPSRPVSAFVDGRIAFDRHRYADALDSFEEAMAAVDKAPDRQMADLRMLTAESLLALERYAEAEYQFEQELEDAPESTRARTGLTAVYRATGRTDEASALATAH
jgi:tetratricopeptide (TPR) repeat protein